MAFLHESYYEAADRELQERNYVAAEEERELAESLEAEAFECRMLAKQDAEWMVREFGPLALNLAAEYQVLASDIAEALSWIELRRAA